MAKVKQVDDRLFQIISDRALSRIPEFKLMEISSIAWAFASVHGATESMLSAISEVLPQKLSLARGRPCAQSLPGILWAFAAMKWSDALAEETARTILSQKELKPKNLAATVWSMARLTLQFPLSLPIGAVQHFGPQELSNTGWALATLAIDNHTALLCAMERRLWTLLEVSKPQELASTIWAFAILQHKPEALLVAMAQTLLSTKVGHLEARHLSSTAWAFATLVLLDGPLMSRVATASVELDLGPQGISNMLWSFATLQLLHFPVMRAMTRLALEQLTQFGSQELSNLVWACGTLIYVDISLLAAIQTLAVELPLRPLELSNTVWAFATLQHGDPGPFARMVMHQLQGLPPEGLAVCAWALVELRCHDGTVLNAIAEAANEQVSAFAQEEFRMLLWALPQDALDAAVSLLEHAEANERHLTAQCLSSLIAEAEQRQLSQLEAALLQRLGGPLCSPSSTLVAAGKHLAKAS